MSDSSHPKRYLRLRQIIGDRKASPPILPIIPVSSSTWWNGCKSGRFPKPIKLGRITVWDEDEVVAVCAAASKDVA